MLSPIGSTKSVILVSCAIICWVLNANNAFFSDGKLIASSFPLVCIDCAPPKTAESASKVVLTTLLSICCAVNVDPPVCT